MIYCKTLDSDGKILSIEKRSTAPQGAILITAEEYATALTEIKQKAALVNQLYRNEITIDDVPEAWRKEIQRRVDERIEAEQEEADISADEALNIILGGAG